MTTPTTPPPSSSTIDPIVYVVAIDATSSADDVLDLGCGLASALTGASELHIVHVMGPITPDLAAVAGSAVVETSGLETARSILDRATVRARERYRGRIVPHVAAGDPWREIVQMASLLRADLVVVGTSGRKGVARLAMGSVAEKVVRHAGCPVLVARKKDHHSRAVPQIEPPCPDCIETQRMTNREKMWCARHAQHHPQAHVHYESPPSFANGSMLIRP